MLCMVIFACNTKSNSSQHSQIEQENTNIEELNNDVANLEVANIIGNWVCEKVRDSIRDDGASSHMCYQTLYTINADGTMKETDHRYFKVSYPSKNRQLDKNEFVLMDDDYSIFTGTWRFSNDTLYKEGILSKIQNGEYKQGQEIPRQETNVSGYSIIRRITKDTLFVAGKDGSTVLFIRK